ncbi:hypothetical protein FB451DRAFT_1417500 [Mycena latifolia]|nr:hypothetical protein FB451DRAFT_1417500 [Mycena latifolia]
MPVPKIEEPTESPQTRDAFSVVEQALSEAQRALAEARTGPETARLAVIAAEEKITQLTAAHDALQAQYTDLKAESAELRKSFAEERKAMTKHAEKISKALDASKLVVPRLQNVIRLLDEQRMNDAQKRDVLERDRASFQAEKTNYETKKREEEEQMKHHHQRTSKMLKRVLETIEAETAAHDLLVDSISLSGAMGAPDPQGSDSKPAPSSLIRKAAPTGIKQRPKKKFRLNSGSSDSDSAYICP